MNILKMKDRLLDARLLRTTSEVEIFEDTISNILEMKDVNHIEILCSAFDDATEDHEVMFGLVHAIDYYDSIAEPEEALKIFAQSINKMLPQAREWVEILHHRILNDDKSRITYKKIISKLEKGLQDVIGGLLIEIRNEDPERFATSVNYILR